MAALMRCCVSRHLNLNQSIVRLLSVSSNYAFGAPAPQRWQPIHAMDKDALVNTVNRKIDLNIGVSNELFQKLYSTCEKNADSVTELDAALLLYVCSIGPFDSPVQKRAETADEIWNKLEHLGVTLSTKLYNLKLKVYTANRTSFNPLDELQKLKSLGLNPDRITYGLLLEGYCQQGDIAAANNVLEAMKTSGYLIGTGIFNSFITGHLKAGSPEEATNVFEVLRSRGLAPDADTYSRFAGHYAEEGDIASVLKYVSQAETDDASISHLTLLDIYRTMVRSGHSSQTQPLLNWISEKGLFRASAVQKSCQLVSEGFHEAAIQLYSVMPKEDEDKFQYSSGSFLVKAMIINGHSAEDVMALADRIVDSNVKSLPHRYALLYAYKSDRTDLAVELLKLMKARNHEIKVPYITPAICSYRKLGNKEGLHDAVRMLLELDAEHCLDDKMENLFNFAYPALTRLKQSRQDIIDSFQGYEKLWNLIFFVADLAKGHSTALNNASGKQLDSSAFPWYELRQHIFSSREQDADHCAEVLSFLGQQGMKEGLLMSLAGDALLRAYQGRNLDNLNKAVAALQRRNLKLRRGIKSLKFYLDAPEDLKIKMDQLCESDQQQVPLRQYVPRQSVPREFIPRERLESMTLEELEAYQKKNPGLKLVHVAMLNKVLETNDLNNIKQKVRELQAVGAHLSIVHLMKIVTRLSALGDTESALHFFEELKTATKNKVRKMIPLNLGCDLVKAGNISEALKMIQAADESSFTEDEFADSRQRFALLAMLKQAPTIKDADTLHSHIFQTTTLLQRNETLQVHAAYITRILKEDNDEVLVAKLVKLYEEYHVFPCMEQVLVRFIKKQEVSMLKKVMDLGISVFGSDSFHIKLALSFIECGLPSKAAAVLRTPGLKLYEKSLSYGCQYFVRGKKIECLEALANITKDMPVSRGIMLQYLLEGYIAVDDLTKATLTLDQFAEGLISPPKEAVSLLVKTYISRNLAIPDSLRAYTTEADRTTEAADTSSSSSSSDSDSESSQSDKDDDGDKKVGQDSPEQKSSKAEPK